jgi:hypothetical protein
MSDPLTIARDYVELYDREHADPSVDRYTLAGLEDDIAMARYIIEQHDKHERLLVVIRDLCIPISAMQPKPTPSLAREILKLIGTQP